MSDVNRRDAVKLAAGLAVGAVGLAPRDARADQAQPVAAKASVDPMLESAQSNSQIFMFREQVTFRIEGDGRSRTLAFTSARDTQGKATHIHVPSAAMRIFRADAGLDEFTRQGGIYWKFRETEGKIQFKQPGALVMVVRDHDDTVRCYALDYDLRC